MKRIDDYRKLLGVEKEVELKELKTVYRTFMKEWHPDKFHDAHEQKEEAEAKSKQIIEAYHFLVSIAPETREQLFPEYQETINTAGIVDFEYKAQTLQVNFADGNSYEYFDVPRLLYTKFINADTPNRFARRHIFTSFVYRNISKAAMAV